MTPSQFAEFRLKVMRKAGFSDEEIAIELVKDVFSARPAFWFWPFA